MANWSAVSGLLPSRSDYTGLRRSWRSDLIAGVTVGIVALPLALAFGVSSGAGAEAGLVTAVIAGVVAAVFGGSHVQVSGPTGAMVVVLAPVIAVHGVGALAMVTILAGIVVVVAGVLKLGRVVGYIPWPVIEGFTLGIAIIIFLQQVPSAFGVRAGESTNAGIAALQAIGAASWPAALWTLGMVAAVVLVMIVGPKLHKKLPASLLAILLVTVIAELADLPVRRIGKLPDSLSAPTVPAVDWHTISMLIGPALTIAALAAIESLLSARVAASISDTGTYDPDRELVGQGLASVASGFFGGIPATGAIARTAVNVRAGAKSRLAAITHGFVLLAVVYLVTGPVAQIPLAALAGVLMVTAARMNSFRTIRSVVGSSKADATVFFVTAVITVCFDLIEAVEIGIVVAAFFALRSLVRTSGVHREEIPGAPLPEDSAIALFRIDGALFFGAAERVLQRVSGIREVDVIIIRMSQLQILDATGARVITDIVTALERRGVTVLIKGIQDRHLQLVTRVGVLDSLRHHKHLFDELEVAVNHARSHVRRAREARGTDEKNGDIPTSREVAIVTEDGG